MIITKHNTKIILIYTNSKETEKRFVTDLMMSLTMLYQLHFNNILVLIDGFKINDIQTEIEKYNLAKPEIKIFTDNFLIELKNITKDNLIICTTGHGDPFSKYLSTKYYPNVYPETIYETINNNNYVKNVFCIWGQCLSGHVYKEIDNPLKNFFLFGAADKWESESSNIFVYEALTRTNKNFSIIRNNDYGINVFLFLFFLNLKFYINTEIDVNDIENLFKCIKSNYITISMIDEVNDYYLLDKLMSNKVDELNNDELIKLYSKMVTQYFELEKKDNLPWLKYYSNNTTKDFSNINEQVLEKFKMDILIINSLLYDLIFQNINKENSITITVEEFYKKLNLQREILTYDKIVICIAMIIALTNEYDKSDIKPQLEQSKFIFNLPKDFHKDSNIRKSLLQEIEKLIQLKENNICFIQNN